MDIKDKIYKFKNPCCFDSKTGEHDGTSIGIEKDIAGQYPEDESISDKIDRMLSRALKIVNSPYPGGHYPNEQGRDGHGPAHSVRQWLLMYKMINILYNKDNEKFFTDYNPELIKIAAFCMSLGRVDEKSFNPLTHDHSKDNANVFKELALGVGLPKDQVEALSEAIRIKCNPDPLVSIDPELQVDANDNIRKLANMMTLVHEADLYRIRFFDENGKVDEKLSHRTNHDFMIYFSDNEVERSRLIEEFKKMYADHREYVAISKSLGTIKPKTMSLDDVRSYIKPRTQGPTQKTKLDEDLQTIVKAMLKNLTEKKDIIRIDESSGLIYVECKYFDNAEHQPGENVEPKESYELCLTDIINCGADFSSIELDAFNIKLLKSYLLDIRYKTTHSNTDEDKEVLEKIFTTYVESGGATPPVFDDGDVIDDPYPSVEGLNTLDIEGDLINKNDFLSLVLGVRYYTYKLDKILNGFLRNPTQKALEQAKKLGSWKQNGINMGRLDHISAETMILDAVGLNLGLKLQQKLNKYLLSEPEPSHFFRWENIYLGNSRGNGFEEPSPTSVSAIEDLSDFGDHKTLWRGNGAATNIKQISVFPDEQERVFPAGQNFGKKANGVLEPIEPNQNEKDKKEKFYNFTKVLRVLEVLLEGNIGNLEDLLEGYDVNQKGPNGSTLFMYALQNANTDILKLLLDKGADVNAKDSDGCTALMLAAQRGRKDLVEALINEGAYIEAKDNYGNTALTITSDNGNKEIFQALFRLSCDTSVLSEYRLNNILKYVAECKNVEYQSKIFDIDKKDLTAKNKQTLNELLVFAVRENNIELVKKCINNGADVNYLSKIDKKGTALTWAAFRGYEKIVDLLLNTPKIEINKPDEIGRTAIYYALRYHRKDLVKAFLSGGADVDATDSKGNSALMYASKYCHIHVVEALLNLGAQVNAKDSDGCTALMLAVKSGHKDVVEVLINKGANTEAKNKSVDAALSVAIENRNKEIVQALFRLNFDISGFSDKRRTYIFECIAECEGDDVYLNKIFEIDKDNLTEENKQILNELLVFAARKSNIKLVKKCLENGAKVNAKTSNGGTALMIAAYNGHKDVVEALLKRGADLGELDERLLNKLAAQADNLYFESLNALALHADNLGDEEFQKLKDTFINKYSDLALTNINVVKSLSNLASQIYIRRAKGNRRSQGNMCFPISLWNKTTKDAKMQDIKNATNLNDTLSKIVKKRSRFGFVISQASVDASEFVNNFIANNSQL